MIEGNHEKTSVMLVGTGIWTRDLPNASLVRYHGAISLGIYEFQLPTVNSFWENLYFIISILTLAR